MAEREVSDKLIDENDFQTLLSSGVTGFLEGLSPLEKVAAEQAFWSAEGVDVRALESYCMWEATDTLTLLDQRVTPLGGRAASLTKQELLGTLAMSTHMGFLIGWFLRGVKEGVPVPEARSDT